MIAQFISESIMFTIVYAVFTFIITWFTQNCSSSSFERAYHQDYCHSFLQVELEYPFYDISFFLGSKECHCHKIEVSFENVCYILLKCFSGAEDLNGHACWTDAVSSLVLPRTVRIHELFQLGLLGFGIVNEWLIILQKAKCTIEPEYKVFSVAFLQFFTC